VPSAAMWLALVAVGRSAFGFAVAYRIPIVLADFGSAMLLRRIALSRGASPRNALLLAAMYAWNPCALLVSGYHFNNDPAVAMFSLLGLYLLQDRGRPLLAGLAIGFAINIKLIPVLLLPALFLTARSRRELLLLIAGLAIMALPYLPPLLLEPNFKTHVLGYKSSPDPWGILLLLRLAFPAGVAPDGEVVAPDHPALFYNRWGTWIVLGCAVAWGFVARWAGLRDRYRIAAVVYALFLVLASGFGVQYLILLAPLLYVTLPARLANLYGVVCGTFQLAAYFVYWDGTFPISSMFNRPFPQGLALLGLVPWGLLILYLGYLGKKGREEPKLPVGA
jgi:hypothetical protein